MTEPTSSDPTQVQGESTILPPVPADEKRVGLQGFIADDTHQRLFRVSERLRTGILAAGGVGLMGGTLLAPSGGEGSLPALRHGMHSAITVAAIAGSYCLFLEGICAVQRYEPPAADWKDHAIAGFVSGGLAYTALAGPRTGLRGAMALSAFGACGSVAYEYFNEWRVHKAIEVLAKQRHDDELYERDMLSDHVRNEQRKQAGTIIPKVE